MPRQTKAQIAEDALRVANPGFYAELDAKKAPSVPVPLATPSVPLAEPPEGKSTPLAVLPAAQVMELIKAPYALQVAPYAWEPNHYKLVDSAGIPVAYLDVPLSVTEDVRERLAVTRGAMVSLPELYVGAALILAGEDEGDAEKKAAGVARLRSAAAVIAQWHADAAADRAERERKIAEQKANYEKGGKYPALPFTSKQGSEKAAGIIAEPEPLPFHAGGSFHDTDKR